MYTFILSFPLLKTLLEGDEDGDGKENEEVIREIFFWKKKS